MYRHLADGFTIAVFVLTMVFITGHAAVRIGAFLPPSQLAISALATEIGTPVLSDPVGISPDVHYVEWANLNRWDDDILAAATRFGVPPEYLKAIIAKESGGYWLDPKTGSIIQNPDSHATGLVQAMPDEANRQLAESLGLADGYTNPADNIMLGAAILAQKHNIALSLGYTGEEAWKVATGGYFGAWPNTMDATDATGTSGTQYVSDVLEMVDEIDIAGQGTTSAFSQ